MRQPIKIDISTDDVITPSAVEYKYKLMFEDRTILLLTYNIETLLAEKIQTILARGLVNTRLRDFYDIYELVQVKGNQIDMDVLRTAFVATCRKRSTGIKTKAPTALKHVDFPITMTDTKQQQVACQCRGAGLQ